MQHSHYGDLQGSFEGRGFEFFKRAWWLWLCAPIVMVLFPLAPFLYAEFKAVEWRWWLSGIRFGDVRLESALPRRALYGLYWKMIGWFVLLAVLSGSYFGFCSYLFVKVNGITQNHPFTPQMLSNGLPILIAAGLGYLAFVLSLNVVMRLYLLRDVWAKVVASVEVHGIEAAADVAAKGDPVSALGEGFADGLDVAGF
jgi:hypothetical protein